MWCFANNKEIAKVIYTNNETYSLKIPITGVIYNINTDIINNPKFLYNDNLYPMNDWIFDISENPYNYQKSEFRF